MAANPWLKTVSLTSLNTNYNLYTLMKAVDPAAPDRCCKLNLQLDVGAGAAKLFIGNDDISGTNFGVQLNAGQVKVWESGETNRILASQIWLRTDTNTQSVHVDSLVY